MKRIAAFLLGVVVLPAIAGPLLMISGGRGVAAAAAIPSSRLIDWTDTGVDGGIPARSTINSTISTSYGDDSTDATTVLQDALDAAAGTGEVVYVPPGIYQTDPLSMSSSETLRGVAIQSSSSSNSIGTGSKSFTVPAGLGYVSGVEVRVFRKGNRGYYMQGAVTGYSGTTLTLNVTASNGTGTYADWRVTGTVLKPNASGNDVGVIKFGESGISSPSASTTKVIASGASRGSTSIVTTSTGPTVTNGQYLVITETNAADVSTESASNPSGSSCCYGDGWADQRLRGQIVHVIGVTGTTTQTITFEPALYSDFSNTPWATPFTAAVHDSGLEDLMIFGQTGDGNNAHITMLRAANCWVSGVDSEFASHDHVEIEWSYRWELFQNSFYDRFVVDSSRPGLITIRYKSSAGRAVDNIMLRMQDGIMLQRGAAGNVIAFNYIWGGYNPSVRNFLVKGISMNHGAYPQWNLIEGNITAKIASDSTWGPGGDSVISRNYASGAWQTRGPDNSRTVDETTYEPVQVNYAIDLWEGQKNYSVVGNILGNDTFWSGDTVVRKPTWPANFDYDTTRLIIAAGKGSDNLLDPIWDNPLDTLIDEGNWDVVTDGQYWSGGVKTIPSSYAYASEPSWWPAAVSWPPIDPANVPADLTTITNSAKYRYDNQ